MDAANKKRVKRFVKKNIESKGAPLKPKVTEGPFVFRCDDIVQFANIRYIDTMRQYLVSRFGEDIRFMASISLFGRRNLEGSVYPGAPFKDKPFDFFMDVDAFFSRMRWPEALIASHGLFHVDHSKLSPDALKMSIIGSCRYLRSRLFVPPFNRSNEAVKKVCDEGGIHLVEFSEGWRSLEHEPFDPDHRLWYFHYWKYPKLEDFAALFGGKKAKAEVSQRPSDARDSDEWWDKGSYGEYEMTEEQNKASLDPKKTRAIQHEATRQNAR